MVQLTRYLGEGIMSKKRKQYSAEYKTKVVLELLQGDLTVAQVASKYDITAKSIGDWKKQFLENASLAFDIGGATKAYKDEIETLKEENDALAKKLGKTTIERDWAVGKLRSLDLSNKKDLVDSKLSELSMARQCEMIELNRSTLYYEAKPVSQYDLKIMHRIDEIYTDISSTYGYRFMHRQLLEDGFAIGVNKVSRLMNTMGIQAIFPKKRKLTSIKNHEHKIYPYLLKEIEITRPNQVWSGDITYIRTHGGFMYLAAIIDWHSRSILSWKLSNTMDTILVIDVLKEAIGKYGTPEIFNSDQGSQYTSFEHTKVLRDHGIKISMNGKGRSIDNIAIERFFRTLKYDEIYINDYQSVSHLRNSIAKYMYFYNFNRFHSALGYKKPMNVYLEGVKQVG
jgi:putative transposase